MNAYAPIRDLSHLNPFDRRKTFLIIVEWLNKNIGKKDMDWSWLHGDLHAQGVYLPTEEDAIIFKLRFGL